MHRSSTNTRPPIYIQPSFIILICALLLCDAGEIRAQNIGDPIDSTEQSEPSTPPPVDLDIISFGLKVVPSPGAGSFFGEYEKLGGTVSSLNAYAMPLINFRLFSFGLFRLTVNVGYGSSSFTDIYGVRDTINPRGSRNTASIVEEFTATAIPVLIGVEFAPVRTQFMSYVGASAGVAYNNIDWKSEVREPTGEFQRPRQNIDGSGVFPAFELYAGIDYRFDRNFWSQSPVRGIFLEGSYLVLPIRRDYFASIRRQGRGLASQPGDDGASLNLGGVTFSVGINLQFLRR